MALTVHITLGALRTHLWCDTCMTSGRVEVNAYTLTPSGPRNIGTYGGCTTCHDREPDEP